MNKQHITESIQRSIDKLTPDVYRIVADAPVQKLPFLDTITAQPKLTQAQTRTKAPVLRLAPVFALLAVILLSYTVWTQLFTITGSVGLDVNPSIQIDVNRFDRVINVKPLNFDAVPIIRGIDYKQVKLEHVVRSLIGSMYYHGYLQDADSAILISVDSRDAKKAAHLEQQVVIEVGELVSLDSSQVYSQILPDDDLVKKSDEYGVSFGLLNLALQAQAKYPQYPLEALFKMPLSMLFDMAHSNPESFESDGITPTVCGVDGIPCTLLLPFIMVPRDEGKPHPTKTPMPFFYDDDDAFDWDDWWDDLWDDDEWDDD